MRGTSSRLHSKAEQVLRLLMDKSILNMNGNLPEDRLFLYLMDNSFYRV